MWILESVGGRRKRSVFSHPPGIDWSSVTDELYFIIDLLCLCSFLSFCGNVFSLRIFSRCSIDSCFQVGYRLSSYWRGFHSPKKASQFNNLLFTMEKYNPCRQTSIVFFNSVFINLEWRSCFYLSLLHQIKRPQQRTWCHRWF